MKDTYTLVVKRPSGAYSLTKEELVALIAEWFGDKYDVDYEVSVTRVRREAN